jgi:hypothetical protein
MTVDSANTNDVLNSRFNRVLAVVIWALDALVTGSVIVADPGPDLLALVPAAFVALFAWEALWRPNIDIGDDRIAFRNVFRTISIPWAALVHIDTKFALTLYTPGHHYSAWAAPAPGRAASVRASRAQKGIAAHGIPGSDGARPGDLIGTDSGDGAYLIRSRWTRLLNDGRIPTGVADATPVEIGVHWRTAAVLVVLAVASVVIAIAG